MNWGDGRVCIVADMEFGRRIRMRLPDRQADRQADELVRIGHTSLVYAFQLKEPEVQSGLRYPVGRVAVREDGDQLHR